MPKTLKSTKEEAPEGDPKRGDEILKRMLQSKPKQHKDMIAERRGNAPVGKSKTKVR
jgi:hypothetical protein